MSRCQCPNMLVVKIKVLVVKIKVLVNFENLGVLPPTAGHVNGCRCIGGANNPLELSKGAVNELVLRRMLG